MVQLYSTESTIILGGSVSEEGRGDGASADTIQSPSYDVYRRDNRMICLYIAFFF